jgi:hypothetical protein
MKHYTLFFCLLVAGTVTLSAQEPVCGVLGQSAYMLRYRQQLDSTQAIENEFARTPATALVTTQLPVQFHIVRSSNGSSSFNTAILETAVNNMNAFFVNAGLSFVQCAAPRFIDDSNFLNFRIDQQAQMVAKSYVNNVINIYCVATIEGGFVAGYTYLPGSGEPDIIVMDDGVVNTTTLTHEMGHFFGLLHTHGSDNCSSAATATNELVNGSNCATAGDFVCDTPADPGLLGAGCLQSQVSEACAYVGVARDAQNQPFVPDTRNIMSYSRTTCRTRLSAGQYARIFSTYKQFRTYLKCSPTSAVTRRLSLSAPLAFLPTTVKAGETFSLTARVRNTGNANFAGAVQAKVFDSRGLEVGVIATIAVPTRDSLAPGKDADAIVLSSPVLTLPPGTYKVGIYFRSASGAAFELCGSESFPAMVDLVVAGTPLPCNRPDSLRIADIGPSSTVYEWAGTQVPGAYFRVNFREAGAQNWSEVPNWTTPRMTFTNRKPCTVYDFQVQMVCPDQVSNWTDILSTRTTGCNAAYCISYGNSLKTFIDEISIGAVEQVSGNNLGYRDFSNLKASVCRGGNLTFTLKAGLAASEAPRTLFWRVWADFNRDNDFDDANEQLFQISEMSNREVNVIWQAPTSLPIGATRLRISMDSRSFPAPCATGDIRDVEDYTLEICDSGNNTLEISTSRIDFGVEGGERPLAIQSGLSWEASWRDSTWISLSPRTGSAGSQTLRVRTTENPGVARRTGLLTFRSGNLSRTLEVVQRGRLVSTDQISATAAGKTSPFQVNADTSWVLLSKPEWVASFSPSVGTAAPGAISSVQINCLPNASDAVRSGFLVIRWADGQQAEVEIVQDKNAAPVNWTFSKTGHNHLVFFSHQLKANINGLPLLPGDFIGFFYKDGTQQRCAGFGRWTGTLDAVTVYGDDAATTAKEGFAPGEAFRVRIWRLSSGTESTVNAVFAAPSENSLHTHTERYALNGISLLNELHTEQQVSFTLQLEEGFDLFSLPILLPDPDLKSLAALAAGKILEIQDDREAMFVPATGQNSIGDLDVRQGYRSKASAPLRLALQGVPVSPSKYPIPVRSGWQLIPFWSLSPKPAEQALSGILHQVEVVKDLRGNLFIPAFGINTLETFTPGKAYWLKSSGPDTLSYPDVFMAPAAKLPAEGGIRAVAEARYFRAERKDPLEIGAVLVVLAEGAPRELTPGDEIAVLDPSGRVAGASVFEGKNMALNVLGMQPGEAYTLVVRDAETQAVWPLSPRFRNTREAYFQAGALGVIESLQAPHPGRTDEHRIHAFPNPASDVLSLSLPAALSPGSVLRLMSTDGREVRRWTLQGESIVQLSIKGLPPGPYFMQLRHEAGIWTEKLIIRP